MKPHKNLIRLLAATATLAITLAVAQGPVQGPTGTPRTETPRQGGGGGGVGIGINIDIGTIFNAIKNATKKDEQDKPPVLQKKAVTVSSGASGNYTIDWVVQYANNTGATLPTATVIDGPISTIIPSSLQPPPNGWAATTNALPLPADNFANWTGTDIAPHGVMTATLSLSSGSGTIAVGGGGDGFQPIPFVHSAGRRVYIMNHHASPGDLSFACVNMTTGASCSASWPRVLPFGDGSGGSGTTSANAEYVIVGSKFYYPAHNFAKWGIGCFDLESEIECGYTPLGASNNQATQTTLTGPWRVGAELYMADYDGQLYCAKLAPGLPSCLGSGYKIPLIDIKIAVPSKVGQSVTTVPSGTAVLDWYNGLIAARVVGTRLYITSRSRWNRDNTLGPTTKYTNCFDTVKKTACWSTSAPSKGTGVHKFVDPYGINQSNFVYYNASGTAIALCTKTDYGPKQECVDLNGAAVTLPTIFSSLAAPLERVTLEVEAWPRTNFTQPRGPNGELRTGGGSFCWDWSLADYCNNNVGSIAEIVGVPGDYGNNIDDRGCIWTFGHNHILWGYDPANLDQATKKAKPCGGNPGKATQTFQPLQYCSGPKPFKWTSIEVKGAPLVNYSKFVIKVLDSANNTVLLTKDLKAANQLLTSVTSIDAQTISKPLKIELEYTPNPGMGASDKPYAEARYDAPPTEFCFKSTHTCKQDKITNIVETPDPSNPNKIVSVKVDVVKPGICPVIDNPPKCGDPGQPPCPLCGQPGQPPCPTCGTPNTPPCPLCGQPGQPPCPICGQPGQPACPPPPPPPPPVCTPRTPGWPLCLTVICTNPPCIGTPPPPPVSNCRITGTCPVDTPQQTIAEEFKEPKVTCVRKTKPVEDAPKKVVPKPKPKPAVAAAPPAAVDPNAPPKPKSKPRPKPAAKPAASNDDCE